MILKCKICGGDMEISADKTFGTCEYCGSTMTLPKIDDEQRAEAFNRGNHFRRIGEFDKALSVYERIVEESPNDAEAHWCCALCRFGIEWVEDPVTMEYLPTCHRASFDIFTKDVDYLAAVELSDGITKKQYMRDAAKISEVQKGILATSQNEEPFDVFICYKESDEKGNRTVDSTLAQEIYYQLTDQGLRVFFARITLEDKTGSEYEPYIFAALNSAKVMVAVGTKPENFNAVWVKNEWSRFLSIVKHDRSKVLLPCYKDMDPYDLPEQLAVLQSYDMAKIGFIQDLIRGITKVVKADELQQKPTETVVINNNTNTAPLLERAFLFLEDGKWQDANIYCEKVLDIDPKNAEAYLGKLMADLQVRTRKQLADCAEPFDSKENFGKVIRFGDEKLESKLRGYNEHIKERNETARITDIYNCAVDIMNAANNKSVELFAEILDKEFALAAEKFAEIPGFKDSDFLREECLQKSKEIAEKATAKREERRIAAEKAEKAEKRQKRIIAITVSVIAVFVAFLIVLTTVIIPKQKLNKAMKLLDSGDYEAAYSLLEELGNYDAINANRCDRAVELIDSGDYEAAYALLDGFNYSDDLGKIKYNKADELIESGDYMAAYILLDGLDYKDSENKRKTFQKSEDWMKLCPVGYTFFFGSYEQDNDTSNGKEDIEWLVLAKEENKVLVISKYVLDCQQYNTSYTDVTWETCSLRKWLNGTFISNAFSSDERHMIQRTTVTADKNPSHSTSPGNNTTDEVFLLSITEANKYFSSNEARECRATAYAEAQAQNEMTAGIAGCQWWLRSPGESSRRAACVFGGGSVYDDGSSVYSYSDRYKIYGCCVRPAMWISLE